MTDKESWWFPKLVDHKCLEKLREDYPESASMSNDQLRDKYYNGHKYQLLWDHIGDAYEEYERLADAYLLLLGQVDQSK